MPGTNVLDDSIKRLDAFRENLDAAYGPNAEAIYVMKATPDDVEGSLASIVSFANEAVS